MRRKLLNFKRSSATDNAPAVEYGTPIDMTGDGSAAPQQSPEASADPSVVTTGSVFDSVLSQELLAPTVATAEAPPAPFSVTPAQTSLTPPSAAPVPPGTQPTSAPVLPVSQPPAAPVSAPPLQPPNAAPVHGLDELIGASSLERDLLRAEMTADVEAPASPAPGTTITAPPITASPVSGAPPVVASASPVLTPPAPASASPSLSPSPAVPELSFWDRYDEATASAELFAVPPAAVTAIVGALHVATPVAKRCRDSHWVTECDVYVLTSRPEMVEDPTWKILKRPSDVVALLDDGLSDFPLIVVDIPRELPTWIRPLTSRLRAGGVGLVRYVLDDDPSDEDLATWHGELGRPSVLDLVAAVPPVRVLDLLDRGEPVASVGGMPITADLLMALRLSI